MAPWSILSDRARRFWRRCPHKALESRTLESEQGRHPLSDAVAEQLHGLRHHAERKTAVYGSRCTRSGKDRQSPVDGHVYYTPVRPGRSGFLVVSAIPLPSNSQDNWPPLSSTRISPQRGAGKLEALLKRRRRPRSNRGTTSSVRMAYHSSLVIELGASTLSRK